MSAAWELIVISEELWIATALSGPRLVASSAPCLTLNRVMSCPAPNQALSHPTVNEVEAGVALLALANVEEEAHLVEIDTKEERRERCAREREQLLDGGEFHIIMPRRRRSWVWTHLDL
jgi:hypothetical protein